jgi:hypothetical protein
MTSLFMHHPAMAALLLIIIGAFRSSLRTRAELALENLALRLLLANVQIILDQPRQRKIVRALCMLLSRFGFVLESANNGVNTQYS